MAVAEPAHPDVDRHAGHRVAVERHLGARRGVPRAGRRAEPGRRRRLPHAPPARHRRAVPRVVPRPGGGAGHADQHDRGALAGRRDRRRAARRAQLGAAHRPPLPGRRQDPRAVPDGGRGGRAAGADRAHDAAAGVRGAHRAGRAAAHRARRHAAVGRPVRAGGVGAGPRRAGAADRPVRPLRGAAGGHADPPGRHRPVRAGHRARAAQRARRPALAAHHAVRRAAGAAQGALGAAGGRPGVDAGAAARRRAAGRRDGADPGGRARVRRAAAAGDDPGRGGEAAARRAHGGGAAAGRRRRRPGGPAGARPGGGARRAVGGRAGCGGPVATAGGEPHVQPRGVRHRPPGRPELRRHPGRPPPLTAAQARKAARRARRPSRTSGHSSARMLYTTVSRKVPSSRRMWRRSTPSRRAPSLAIAACECVFSASVWILTRPKPQSSKQCASRRSLASGLTAVPHHRRP